MATHYQVLNLTQSILDSQHDPSSLIKRAYHRALLQNHPDKKTPGEPADTSASKTSQPSPSSSGVYTIDRIQEAYAVLSSPAQRASYDTSLRLGGDGSSSNGDVTGQKFHTGVENVDLDDLDYDDDAACWFRPCRCGNDKGYLFREDDLEDVGDEGELMVGCLDCSLWLRVHFAVVEDDEGA